MGGNARWRVTSMVVRFLVLSLAAGATLGVAAVAGPPPGPPPPPAEEPPPPPTEPCAWAPLPAEIGHWLRAQLAPEELTAAAASLADGTWPVWYDGGDLKLYLNPVFSGIQALLNFPRLGRGALVGGMKASGRFQIVDRGRCFPALGTSPAVEEGGFLLWMAHAPTLGTWPLPELALPMNWFMVLLPLNDPFAPAGVIFYPDPLYRSPEAMLRALRPYDEGGTWRAAPGAPQTD